MPLSLIPSLRAEGRGPFEPPLLAAFIVKIILLSFRCYAPYVIPYLIPYTLCFVLCYRFNFEGSLARCDAVKNNVDELRSAAINEVDLMNFYNVRRYSSLQETMQMQRNHAKCQNTKIALENPCNMGMTFKDHEDHHNCYY